MRALRVKRKERSMTLKQLGDIVGVSAVTISRYEKGEREPNIGKLKALSTVLGTTVDELIAEDNDEVPNNRANC